MSAVQIQVRHRCCKDGREPVERDPRPGRPATSRTPENVEHGQTALNKDQPLTVREPEADLGIVTQDLGMKPVEAKFVPRLLHPEWKEHRAAIAKDLIQTTTSGQISSRAL